MNYAAKLTKTFLRTSITEGPFHFIFFVTARCNARCRMCFYLKEIANAEANLHNELTIDEIRQVFGKLGFVPYISLSGGEPFLRKDVAEILDCAARECAPLVISTPTNCSTPMRIVRTFERLCPDHPDVQFEVQVSMDGVGHVHDEVRRVPGLFDRVLETLKLLDGLRADTPNLKIKLVTTYSSYNHDGVAELIEYAERNLAFDRMILAWAHGNCDEETHRGLEFSRYRELLDRVEDLNVRRHEQQGPTTHLARFVKKGKEAARAMG